MTTLATRRTRAQVTALRRFALTWAWDQAYHVVSCYAPGAKDLRTEARRLLARGWVEAKLAEKHGHLVVAEAVAPAPAPAAGQRLDRCGSAALPSRHSCFHTQLTSSKYRP